MNKWTNVKVMCLIIFLSIFGKIFDKPATEFGYKIGYYIKTGYWKDVTRKCDFIYNK